jgi:thiosulfate/3-mercaptopyruvate sulfurtransferase
MDSLVSTDWLANELGAADLRIVDASYHLPEVERDAAAEYAAGHIPGAVFLDLAALVDPASPIDNTMPSPEQFAERMRQLGIANDNRIVVYDDSAGKSSARAWFMLTTFGADKVAVLDGGLGKWKAEGRALAQGVEASPAPARFDARSNAAKLRTKAQVTENLASAREQVVDARAAGRFTGEQKEVRPGLASGHIPGSRGLHYAKLYNADGRLKSRAELTAAFEEAGVDLSRPLITSCGSGMTACALTFALHRIGKEDVALYDGSWAEWGADPETPKATGPA